MKNNNDQQVIEEDEIDLRELFATIGRYKWSIIFFTLLITFSVAVKVYFMPKYYNSTVTIEVKPEDNQAGGFSMGGAAALFLSGAAGGSTNLEKDITLLQTYRTNEKVLNKTKAYMIRYFITDKKHKEIEVDSNLSIKVTDVKINDFKAYGMRLLIEPLSSTEYKLLTPGRFSNESIGIYHYSEMVTTKSFTLMIHKEKDLKHTYIIQLSGSKRYLFETVIKNNLSVEADESSPFLTLSFIDNLPERGEKYLKNLMHIYTKQSIQDVKEDALVLLSSYEQQLKEIEQRVDSSSRTLEAFKTKNRIISPELQAMALVQELSTVGIQIAQNKYKEELLANLIKFVGKHNNIDAIAPSLIELQDEPTMSLIKLIQTQQLALDELLIKYKSSHPNIVRANQTIYNLKRKVLLNLKNLQKTLKDKTKSLQNMENKYNQQLKSSPKQEQQLISFSRDYKVNEKMYLYLMQERSGAKLTHDKALSRFRIIEDIYTADGAVKPKKVFIVIVSFITALILMIFITFFREFIKKDKNDYTNK